MTLPFDTITSSIEFTLVASLLVGLGFGFVLERAGFGRSTKLAAQFYLTDMTVLKVMFTAIVTATIGLGIAGGLGWIEVGSLSLGAASYTFIWPMLFGGLLFGVGFVVSGYCPGTSIVASASGHVDGLVAFAGVVLGSLVFGEAYSWIEVFHTSGNLGHFFLGDWMGVSRPVVVVLVTVVALGAFLGAETLERIFTKRTPAQAVAFSQPRSRVVQRAVFGGLALAAVATLALPNAELRPNGHVVDEGTISAETLAQRLLDAPWTVRVIDLREREAWVAGRIPGSESVPTAELPDIGLAYSADHRDLVLVGAAGLDARPAASNGYPGRVLLLDGGFGAWSAYALTQPEPPSLPTPVSLAAYGLRSEVHRFLTGQASAPPPAAPVRRVAPRPAGGGGGGCD